MCFISIKFPCQKKNNNNNNKNNGNECEDIPLKSIRYSQICQVRSVFRGWSVVLSCDFFFKFFFFFYRESGWVRVIKFTNLPNLTRLTYIEYIFKIKIYYTIFLFTFFSIFLNKIKTLSSPQIIYVCLMICSWLFSYKFAFICGGVILMLNLKVADNLQTSTIFISGQVGLSLWINKWQEYSGIVGVGSITWNCWSWEHYVWRRL